MAFWLAVLMGALFAWVGVQVGFYASWIMLFNLVLSAYMAIFLSPVIIANVPAATDTPYGYALVLASIATATLLVAYGTCYACLAGRLYVPFPKIFDNIAAGTLGFLSGFLIWSFVSLLVCLTPLTEIDVVKTLGFECDAPAQKTNRSYVCWWCDRLHGWVASSDSQLTSKEAVDLLLESAKSRAAEVPQPGAPEPPGQPGAPSPAVPSKGAERSVGRAPVDTSEPLPGVTP